MITAFLSPSKKAYKKWTIVIYDKKIHFGDSRYKDYTQHKNKERKRRYILRHAKREDWKDPLSAGFWSRWLLWNKPTIRESKASLQSKFKIKVKQ